MMAEAILGGETDRIINRSIPLLLSLYLTVIGIAFGLAAVS